MSRTTIDYGIDLGTTNSKIAFLAGTVPEVVPNKDGSVLTPSAIWFDKRGKQYVGKDAKARFFDDDENAAVEFKLHMGENWHKTFRRTGKQMFPEEMSAEVLKSLKLDVHTNKGEDIGAAVITVPADFTLAQCEATRRAANLAGFSLSPLLQEPVAAALAYGFQSESNKVFWLVYDFGGGTFDAAVIQVRDGVIQVVNHAGDNRLGGQNIDWDIVEKLLVPDLLRQRRLTDFNQGNTNWKAAFAKLKAQAEEKKIQVSRTQQPAELYIEDLCADEHGESIDFVYELTPSALEEITAPWVEQSLTLCRKALQEKGLSGQNMEKLILVGGSSLFPWLQKRVSAGLGAPVEFSIDPMTVVARGAAVFAGSQRLEAPAVPVQKGIYTIQLEYEPVGKDTDPPVVGRVTAPKGATVDGLRVEIVELRSQWRSGCIALGKDGTFMTEIHAEKGRKCEYELILTDSTGSRLSCTPGRFAYTVGMVITSPPLTHNIGIDTHGNKPAWFFKKGQALPTRAMKVCHNAYALRKNAPAGSDNVIRIPFIEGTNATKSDRNGLIGALEILPSNPKVKRDIPLGADIEITIEIDVSRILKTKAFIPILDEEFEEVFKPRTITKSPAELSTELGQELNRLKQLQEQAQTLGDECASSALAKLDQEKTVDIVSRQVAAAQGDDGAVAKADHNLLALKSAVDSVEEALKWPGLVREAYKQVQSAREVVDAHGQPAEKEKFKKLEAEAKRAIDGHQLELLRACIEDLRGLGTTVVLRQPEFWVGWLQCLAERKTQMRDQATADRLFAQGHRSIQTKPCDFEALKAAVRQLIALLPPDEREAAEDRGKFGGTIVFG